MQSALGFLAHAFTGFVLMFLAHFAASLGHGHGLPYWWSYLVLYPIATIVSVRLKLLSPTLAAIALCLVPVVYFAALGVFEGSWHASNNALLGAGLAFAISLALATLLARPRASSRAAA